MCPQKRGKINSKDRLSCYSYPDSLYDVKIASKLAKAHGATHTVLDVGLSRLPTLEELQRFSEEEFGLEKGYKAVFHYMFHNSRLSLLNKGLKVLLFGLGGDTRIGSDILPFICDNLDKENTVDAYLSAMLNKNDLLTAEYCLILFNRTSEYLKNKYLDLLRDKDAKYLMNLLFYQFERVRCHIGFAVAQTDSKYSDVFMPLLCESFIITALNSPLSETVKHLPQSRYHKLETLLTNNNAPLLPFSTGNAHWDAKYTGRLGMAIINYRDKFLRGNLNFVYPEYGINYSKKTRTEFLKANYLEIEEIILSNPQSDLWDYIDRNKVLNVLKARKNNIIIKKLYTIIPLLKYLNDSR